jgi:hypothetical protein
MISVDQVGAERLRADLQRQRDLSAQEIARLETVWVETQAEIARPTHQQAEALGAPAGRSAASPSPEE